MITSFDRDGHVVGEYFKRSMFPFHADTLREGMEIGEVSFGLTKLGQVWMWLPGEIVLATVSPTGTMPEADYWPSESGGRRSGNRDAWRASG